MKKTIGDIYGNTVEQLILHSTQSRWVTHKSVFQEANEKNRQLVDTIITDCLLPRSQIVNYERLTELYALCKRGKSCLILMEHYSNFDIPCLCNLLSRNGTSGIAIDKSLIAMSAVKLNEESPFVLAFTEAYTRIVIYPARIIAEIEVNSAQYKDELKVAHAINKAALKQIEHRKEEGHIVLMFPTGTRYKPGQPDTKKVLRAADAYIKRFDYMVCIGSAGNVLELNDASDMSGDYIIQDSVFFVVGEVQRCRRFRKQAREDAGEHEDRKRAVASAVEHEFARLHAEAVRLHRESCDRSYAS